MKLKITCIEDEYNMENAGSTKLSFKGNFNTLALSRTNDISSSSIIPNIIVFGEGTDRNNKKALKGRAKRKTITQTVVLSLIKIAKEKGAQDREKAYRNTYYCQSRLITSGDRIYGSYCKNRFCSICCSIRKAELINKYFPVLKEWEDAQFVTLTVRAVQEHELYEHVRTVKKKFRQIIDLLKKRHQRGKGEKPIGIYSLECNFNPKAKSYNPHFHIIVPSRERADRLFWEWRKKWAKGQTSIWAQKIRKVKDTEADLVETIKYGAKLFTSPDMKKKSSLPPVIYAAALDNIHCAFSGLHIFGSFGLKLPQNNQFKKIQPKELKEYEEWVFNAHVYDWMNFETGELLTDYRIPSELKLLLENNIDITST